MSRRGWIVGALLGVLAGAIWDAQLYRRCCSGFQTVPFAHFRDDLRVGAMADDNAVAVDMRSIPSRFFHDMVPSSQAASFRGRQLLVPVTMGDPLRPWMFATAERCAAWSAICARADTFRVKVLYAARDIEADRRLEPADLAERPIPPALFASGDVYVRAELYGYVGSQPRENVLQETLLAPLKAGDPILDGFIRRRYEH